MSIVATKTHKHVTRVTVPGYGSLPSDVMLVGEAPGREEAAQGRPFVGKSGKEQDWYLTRVNLSADRWYKTNVCKEYVESNPDPTSCQLSRYRKELEREVVACQPRLIVAVGRFAARTFLGDTCDMELVHGLPHKLSEEWTRVAAIDHTRVTVIPVYHPAAGFYDNDRRAIIAGDYSQIRDVLEQLKNQSHVWTAETLIEHAFYKDVTGAEMADTVKGCDMLSFDTEGIPARPWSIQISPRVGTSFVLRCTQPDFAVGITALQRCANTGTLFIVHNAMYDLEMCREMGLDLGGAFLWDTMYAAYLMRLEPQGLKALAYRWCGIHMSSYRDTVGGAGRDKQLAYLRDVYTRDWPKPVEELIRDNDGSFRVYKPKPIETRVEKIMMDILSEGPDAPVNVPTRWKALGNLRRQVEKVCGPLPIGTLADIPLEDAVQYSALDADATFRLYYRMSNALSKQGLTDLMSTGMEVLPMFEEMQANGMPVSISKLRTLSTTAQAEMNKLRHRLSTEYRDGRPFNPGSSKDVGALMRHLQLTDGRRTPTGKLATGKKEIEHLRSESPAMDYVLTYREWSKVDGTFCRPVLERFEDADLTTDIVPVHCRIKITRTASRRLSMAEPNLMAVPIRSDLGRQVRDAYTCVDDQVFGAWDLSQIEARLMAHLSQDETLIQHYVEDRDVHAWTAAQIFGIDLEDVHPMEHRYPAKRAAFGIINGIAGEGLFVQLRMMGCKGWNPESCTKFIAQWLTLYRGVKRYQRACAKEIKRTGYIDDMWGFRRHLPGVWSDDIRVRSEAERTASSHMIQGGAQGWIQNSMAWLYPRLRQLRSKGLNGYACLQVHDEIVLRFDKDLWEVLDPLMHEALCEHGGVELSVPVKAEGHMSKTWGGLK